MLGRSFHNFVPALCTLFEVLWGDYPSKNMGCLVLPAKRQGSNLDGLLRFYVNFGVDFVLHDMYGLEVDC